MKLSTEPAVPAGQPASPGGDQLPVFHVVGFTGHRQLQDEAGVTRVLREVLARLREDAQVEWLALSSIAAGSDMLFARTALELQMGWEVILPLPTPEFRQDFDDHTWPEVESLLHEAEHVRVITERPQREDAYLDCGMDTVNHCDVLLAVWDGEPARGRGGTAEIVAYAREMQRPVIVIDARTLTVRHERFERLRLGDRHMASLNRLPPAASGTHSTAGLDADSGRATVLAFHRKADQAATRGAPHFRQLTTITAGLHVAVTTLAAVILTFGWQSPILPWLAVLCLLAALGVAIVLRRRRDRHEWMRCRLAAEITRSALATWGLPRALRLFDDFEWAGIEPLRRSLDVLQRRSARERPASFDEFRQRYVTDRLDGQLEYFARQKARAVPLLRRLRTAFFATSALAILATAAFALHRATVGGAAPRWAETWIFSFAPLVLPLLAAGCVALVSINDLHRRVARYGEMHVRLQAARKEAVFVQTWGSLERVVAKAERALLQEVFEWHSITSFTETH